MLETKRRGSDVGTESEKEVYECRSEVEWHQRGQRRFFQKNLRNPSAETSVRRT